MPSAELTIEFPFLFAALSSLSLPVAVVGFAVGAYVGSLNRTASPNLPLALGVVFGAVFYVVAEILVLLVAALLVGGLIVAVLVYRPTIERALDRFARSSGRHFTSRRYTTRGAQVTDEFSQRQSFLAGLPVEPKERDQLRKKDRNRFCNAIDRLGTQYPYAPDDAPEAASNSMPIDDLYDME